jgi:hypothetical protein
MFALLRETTEGQALLALLRETTEGQALLALLRGRRRCAFGQIAKRARVNLL